MSHASLRMIVHVCNGIWRPLDSHATDEQRERFVLPLVAGEIKVAFTLTEPTAGTGADLRCIGHARGRHLLPERREAPDHVRDDRRLPAAVRAASKGTRGADGTVALLVPPHGEGDHRQRDARDDGRARHRPRPPHLRSRARPGRQPPRRGGRRPRRRAERLPGAQPDRRGDDLRRPGAARARPGGRSTPSSARRSASRSPSARRSRSSWPRWQTDIAGRARAGAAVGAHLGGGRRRQRRVGDERSCSRSTCCSG